MTLTARSAATRPPVKQPSQMASLWYRLTMLSPRRRRIAEVGDLWMFSLKMATLLDAGVDVVSALGEVERWAHEGNSPALAEAVDAVRRRVRQGRSVADSMGEHEVFPPMLVELAKAGEWTGSLAGTFAKAADFYGRELDHLNRIPRHCVHAPDPMPEPLPEPAAEARRSADGVSHDDPWPAAD